MFSVALAFFVASSAPATAAVDTVPPAPRVKERKICKVDDVATGTLTPKRVCKTKAEWEGRATQDGTPSTARPAQAPGGSR